MMFFYAPSTLFDSLLRSHSSWIEIGEEKKSYERNIVNWFMICAQHYEHEKLIIIWKEEAS